MRIPLPVRLPLGKSLAIAGVLALVQAMERTDPAYVLLVFCFLLFSVLAFNTAGGFTRPSGAYIFFFSLLVVDVGTVYKALLGQPAQSNLQAPLQMMGVYVVAMLGMLLAAFVSRNVATSRDGMAGVFHLRTIDYDSAAVGCFMLFLILWSSAFLFSTAPGSLLKALTQVNQFLPLSIMLGTIAAVRASGGRRSTSWFTLVVLLYSFYLGTTAFSKQGMFTPLACWLIGIAWTRYSLRLYQIALLIAFAVLAQQVLVPLAGIGRDEMVTGTAEEREQIVEHHLTHIHELHQLEAEHSIAGDPDLYYGTPQGIFDRLTMMPNDAQLMDFTSQGHLFGYLAVRAYFENWVPHIIDPHKLEGVSVGGNTYAHEMGQLADEDTTTGISYSPAAEAFHIDGWRGVALLMPAVMILLFVVTDAISGDLRVQPWGMLPMLIFAHYAPEALLGGAIYWTFTGNLGLIFAIVCCGYVTPLLGLLLRGERRARGFVAPAQLLGHTKGLAGPEGA